MRPVFLHNGNLSREDAAAPEVRLRAQVVMPDRLGPVRLGAGASCDSDGPAICATEVLVLCDGQEFADPRRFGLACRPGVILDVPTRGCAKERLGVHRPHGRRRCSHVPRADGGEVVGEVLRARDDVQPRCVSVGRRVTPRTATEWALRLATHDRRPEPGRGARIEVSRARREANAARGYR